MSESLQALLEEALVIAQEAGHHIMTVFRTATFDVAHKPDRTPVTAADLLAHRHIVMRLRQRTPDVPILSEEDAAIPFETRQKWGRYWLVDPLDGTQEFVRRECDFTVNIALIEDGQPILGVVHAPALDWTCAAARAVGAWRLQDGNRIRLRSRRAPARWVVVASKSHRDARLEAFLDALPPHEGVSRGSSLKFLMIADGTADLHPRTGPTSEWDTAAGHCIAELAGGQVLTLPKLQALRYNQKPALINPPFIVIGDPNIDWLRLLPPLS